MSNVTKASKFCLNCMISLSHIKSRVSLIHIRGTLLE